MSRSAASEPGPLLVLYSHPRRDDAPTIREYVDAFTRHSAHATESWNVRYGITRKLRSLSPGAVILHYSLFGSLPFRLTEDWRRLVASYRCPKIGIFQDEMHYCDERFKLISELDVSAVATLLHEDFHHLYLEKTCAKHVFRVLTAYVSDDLIAHSRHLMNNWSARSIDVGYRGRELAYWYGRGGREKYEIAEGFLLHGRNRGLHLDISTNESDRIRGKDWWHFLSECKFALGTMSGTSIFDLDGSVERLVSQYLGAMPYASFEEVSEQILSGYEGNIPYRAISPRLFEYAAFGAAMILFEDTYDGVVKPNVHYIPLAKDFSNIDTVLDQMQDNKFVESLRHQAYDDLILSGKYHYRKLVHTIEAEFEKLGAKLLATTSIEPRLKLRHTRQTCVDAPEILRSVRKRQKSIVRRLLE